MCYRLQSNICQLEASAPYAKPVQHVHLRHLRADAFLDSLKGKSSFISSRPHLQLKWQPSKLPGNYAVGKYLSLGSIQSPYRKPNLTFSLGGLPRPYSFLNGHPQSIRRCRHCLHVMAMATDAAERVVPTTSKTHSPARSHTPSHQPADVTAVNTGMAVTWLGTSSGAPTRTRNVSSIALRLPKETFMVDCGEATCRQAVVGGIVPALIKNIFITHLHGDHCFGLVGMLSLVSADRVEHSVPEEPFRVFGPPGVFYLLRTTLGYTDTRLAMPIIVTEWTIDSEASQPPTQDPTIPGLYLAKQAPDVNCQAHQGSIRTAQPVSPEDEITGVDLNVPLVPGFRWTVNCSNSLQVNAAQLRHRVPCWGYVFKEPPAPPQELPVRLQAVGLLPGDGKALLRKGIKPSAKIETPSGRVVPLGSLFSPPTAGRKVVLLGDTCDSMAIEEAARGADVVSHEATYQAQSRHKAHRAQHSTAQMAGAFCRKIGANWLFLTHFSSRYTDHVPGNEGRHQANDRVHFSKSSDDASMTAIEALQQEAQAAMQSRNVACVQDFFTHEVRSRAQQTDSQASSPATQAIEALHTEAGSIVAEDPLLQNQSVAARIREDGSNTVGKGRGRQGRGMQGRGRQARGRQGRGENSRVSLRQSRPRPQNREYLPRPKHEQNQHLVPDCEDFDF